MNGTLPTRIAHEPDKLAVVEALRKDFGAAGALEAFEVEDETLRVIFKTPGRTSEATVRREDGQTAMTHESRGFVGVLTDLHRGKTSGPAWGLVIDGVCVIFLVVSVTGLILWSSLRSRGKHGLAVVGLGLLVAIGVYWFFVP
jgi:hypothetical protein